ncbi:MAG: acyl-CoA thioesterase II [Sinobacteraceae bacterium]|nr:acyl-CoA thioesterase II [Nevskiaceae bacterium]MCP5466460.1 acyl-CoA thioesterase II [Nevskiaceae bacterium]
MDPRLADLLQQFSLERLEVNLFRGQSRDFGSPQVYGGQVLGQALMAAYATIEADQTAHSLHAYFLRRGDYEQPIVYQVDRSRDGRSFASRRVIAIQHGEQIFTLAASFQRPESGIEHQVAMPSVPPPEALPDSTHLAAEALARLPERMRRFMAQERPFELRRVEPLDVLQPRKVAPIQHVWLRTVDRLPDDDQLHRCLLAYVSDYNLLATATLPHALRTLDVGMVTASLDHVVWFHRPFRLDEWLLYSMDSPSASGSRGFVRGSIYSRDGRLVASTAQEGLIRVVAEPAAVEAVE